MIKLVQWESHLIETNTAFCRQA